jgi:hypothetical protein
MRSGSQPIALKNRFLCTGGGDNNIGTPNSGLGVLHGFNGKRKIRLRTLREALGALWRSTCDTHAFD